MFLQLAGHPLPALIRFAQPHHAVREGIRYRADVGLHHDLAARPPQEFRRQLLAPMEAVLFSINVVVTEGQVDHLALGDQVIGRFDPAVISAAGRVGKGVVVGHAHQLAAAAIDRRQSRHRPVHAVQHDADQVGADDGIHMA